jgi:hypothetical protein
VIWSREVTGDIVCIGVGIVHSSLSVNVVEDDQPVPVVWPAQPAHHIPNDDIDIDIDIASTCSGIRSAALRDLAFRDPACTNRNTLLKTVFGSAIEPEHRAEPPVVPPCKLDRKLCLAYPAKSMEHEHLLAAVLSLWEKGPFEFRHIRRPVNKLIYHRDAL